MRFIYSHLKTKHYLQSWGSGQILHTAGFFFYHLGSDEQKSQDGLFRGLLHDLLQDQPELIAKSLPEMWREALISDAKLSLPTHAEMIAAFRRLTAAGLQDHKYCLFIDGLDEFSGQPDVIVDVVHQLADLPNVKLMVSSRPINSCYAAFSRGPRLQLQDLTCNDMAKYIDDTIGSRAHMSRHQRLNPQLFPRLRTELVEKATGVFLWLVLVCQQQLSTALSDERKWK